MIDCLIEAQLLDLSKGAVTNLPGDKSISHRAIILGALANNKSEFSNFLFSEDCLNTLQIFKNFGVPIESDEIKKGTYEDPD